MNLKSIGMIVSLCQIIRWLHPLSAEGKTYAIEGKIEYVDQGKIFVYLVDEEIFSTPLTGLQTIILDTTASDKYVSSVVFKFQNLKPGRYGIRCFQDTNGNGKLDQGLFGPSEPWGMSWKSKQPSKWPRFENVAFQVHSDLQPIVIELQ